MTGSRLIVLATGISVSGVETWVWKLATWLSGRGDGAESNYTKYPGWQFWWPWTGAGYLFRDLDPLLKFH